MARRSKTPNGAVTSLRLLTRLKVPAGTNVITADIRSLVPAAFFTMLGVGAELGIIGVLAFSLSALTPLAKYFTLATVIVMGIITLCYAVATTRSLTAARSGSALTAESGTSGTL
jgi:hypothetical protein